MIWSLGYLALRCLLLLVLLRPRSEGFKFVDESAEAIAPLHVS